MCWARVAAMYLLFVPLSWSHAKTFLCGPLALGFEEGTGRWNELGWTEDSVNLLGGDALPEVVLEGELLEWPQDWQSGEPRFEALEEEYRITVTRSSQSWAMVHEVVVMRGEPMLGRRVRLTWQGENTLKVWGCRMRVPGITLGQARDTVWCLPGNYPVRENPVLEALPKDRWQEKGWTWGETGVAYVRSEEKKRALWIAHSLEEDHATVWVEGEGGSVSLGHRFNTLALVRPGDVLEFGTQWILVANLEQGTVLDQARALCERAHPGPPEDRASWLDGAVIAELHPWGRLEAWWSGDKGKRMEDLTRQIPYLKQLGVTGVWLLPVSNPPPWVYFLPSFRRIDPQVATPKSLKEFIQVCHELDMRVLMDLVTYGISPDSPDVDTLPDRVWCRNETGQRDKAWGDTVLTADLSVLDWQEHIVDLCSYWVSEFGCDGFRLDCGGQGQKPNWSPERGPKLNQGMLAGGVNQNARIRERIREINLDAILLPEAGDSAHFRSGDLLFDYPLYMAMREMTRYACVETWVRETETWLDAQRFTHTPRQLLSLVRFLENHDTVSALEFFGAGPAQALTSLCVFLPGVYLLHQEEEVGFAPLLERWLQLRHDLPEFSTGDVDYLGVWSENPRILAFGRESGQGVVVVAVHFGASPTNARIQWNEDWTGRFPCAVDAMTGIAVSQNVPMMFPSYGTRILMLRADGSIEIPLPIQSHKRSGQDRLLRGWVGHGISEERTRHRLRVGPVRQWYIRTGEGFLWDHFQGYRVQDVPPLERSWYPWRHGLLDVAGGVVMGVISQDGRGVEIRANEPGEILDLWLEDPSGLGKQVEMVVEARPGKPPFRCVELEDAEASCQTKRNEASFETRRGRVQVDPHWVRVKNESYRAVFSRRHGGTLADLRLNGRDENILADLSEIYSDVGLFAQGAYVASRWETQPRLTVRENGTKSTIRFEGTLRSSSWNGVQKGAFARPELFYVLTYTVDETPVIRVDMKFRSSTDRKDVEGFLAYRIPFWGVEQWQGVGTDSDQIHWGSEVADKWERVCQTQGMDPGQGQAVSYRFSWDQGVGLTLGDFGGDSFFPQNLFLLRKKNEDVQFFFACLDGSKVSLKEQRTYAFQFSLECQNPPRE